MKTGRLLKFHRPGGDVHAYLYQEGPETQAAIYRMCAGADRSPIHTIKGSRGEDVEAAVRAWVEEHFPRA